MKTIFLSPEKIAIAILGGFVIEIAKKAEKTPKEVLELMVNTFIESAMLNPIQTQIAIDELEEEIDRIANSFFEEIADDCYEEEVN